MTQATALKTFLWFKSGQLDQALDFYGSVFTDFEIRSINRMGQNGSIFTADFSIHGHDFIGMAWDGGPDFNDSISLSLNVDGQEEVDRLWNALTEKGEENRCGWCRDQFGLSWQVSPIQMRYYLENPDSAIREFANQALMKMTKIVIADFVNEEQK